MKCVVATGYRVRLVRTVGLSYSLGSKGVVLLTREDSTGTNEDATLCNDEFKEDPRFAIALCNLAGYTQRAGDMPPTYTINSANQALVPSKIFNFVRTPECENSLASTTNEADAILRNCIQAYSSGTEPTCKHSEDVILDCQPDTNPTPSKDVSLTMTYHTKSPISVLLSNTSTTIVRSTVSGSVDSGEVWRPVAQLYGSNDYADLFLLTMGLDPSEEISVQVSFNVTNGSIPYVVTAPALTTITKTTSPASIRLHLQADYSFASTVKTFHL